MASYKISEIEGIGPKYAAQLEKAGVRSVNDLLKKGAAAKGRKEIAAASGIDQKMIMKWVNMADLFRVKGIGQEYSELLEKAGVDTVKELRNRNAENLYAKMAEVNSAGRALVRQLPGKKSVESWVEQYPSREDYLAARRGEPHKVYRRAFGDDVVHSGSWMMGVKLTDELWKMYEDGKITAFSPGGFGFRRVMRPTDFPKIEFVDLIERRSP